MAILVGFFTVLWRHRTYSIAISNRLGLSVIPQPTLPISPFGCDPHTRPFAVMLSSDPEARPLSGIGEAEMVFEVPVTDNGINRMMAVFRCHHPQEIGSVRSSRLDFIPLAQGLDAIYGHWGGEHVALTQLNSGIIDNIDGLKYEGSTYFRKHTIRAPHNGFTSYALLTMTAEKRNYTFEHNAPDYTYTTLDKSSGNQSPPEIYTGPMRVTWHYNTATNDYSRTRDTTPEIDHISHQQVSTKNVVIMHTIWSPISRDYIRVQTLGSGNATIYRNGEVVQATWQKQTAQDMLKFYDTEHHEISFIPGTVWIEVVAL